MVETTVKVRLGIDADVTAAKRAISSLEASLTNLHKAQASRGFEDFGLNEAVQNAKILESSLNRAFNQNTNKLDLSVLNKNLREAGTSINEISAQFLRAGRAGQQAFMSLATAVAHTEVPLKKANQLVQSFARTLKNTVQYQISAAMFQAVSGAISDAISYTKNLNSSLNDIRIVTGQSAAEMAKFAQAANASAQKLSTTTTSYAKASLIFYQQGLSDAEVKKRTDAVIKMANVTKENMEDVSSYMTAVWNNFDDGSESLEHYADVITALGAATASSTKEIAAGLEKFASIGKTIGLSYDYATSALATIVSKTRQSADTVGTGLRTIFSRLQGLSLGETLEDGVDLNKYSAALKTVGVNILDVTGNMKDMDTILESLASKWQNLSNAQKTALAQTVGGVRQYTTLISLMDNWDSMEQNLGTAKNAEDSLQRQQEIYAESWEAASNRSKAAVEELFSTLLNDKGFIKMTNSLTAVTKAVTALANGFGGLPGILSTIGMVATKVFSQQITSGISDSLLKLNTWAGQFKGQGFWGGTKTLLGGKSKSYEQVNASNEMKNAQKGYKTTMAQLEATGKKDSSEYYAVQAASQLLAEKQKLLATEHTLSAAAKAKAQVAITAMAEEQAAVLALKQEKEALAEAEKKSATASIKGVVRAGSTQKGTRADGSTFVRSNNAAANWLLSRADGYNANSGVQGLIDLRQKQSNAAYQTTMASKYTSALNQLDPKSNTYTADRTKIMNSMNATFGPGTVTKIEDIEKALQKIINSANAAQKEIQDVIEGAQRADLEAGNALEDYVGKGRDHGESQGMIDWEHQVRTNKIPTGATTQMEGEAAERQGEEQRKAKTEKIAGGMQKASQALMSFTAGLSQASTLMATLGDESATTAEKITSGMSVATSALSAFATGGILGGVAYLAGLALTIGLDAIDKAYRAAEIAAEQAQADAEALKQNYETIKESYDNLLSTFDSYKEGSNTLDSLIVGTNEWKEALIKTNEAALQLINNLGLIEGQDYTIGTNGEITFTKEGQNRIDQAQSDKLQETLTAQSAANLAQAEAASARAKADLDIATKANDKGRLATAWSNAALGAGTGALIGTVAGGWAMGIGTAVGAIIGGVGGLLGGLWDYDRNQEKVNKVERDKVNSIVKKYEDRNGTMTDSELKDLIDKQFAGESESYKKSILKVVKSTIEANKQLNDAMKLAAQNVLNSNEIYNSMTNSDAQEDVSARASKIYKDAAEVAGAKFDSTTDKETRKQWAQEYAESLTAGKQGVDIQYNDNGSFSYRYIGDDGHVTEDFKVTETMLRTWYKSSQGDAAVNAGVEALSQVYTDLREGRVEGISKSSQAAIASMSSRGNLNDMTADQINGFSDADLEVLTQDQLTALGFVDLADARAKRAEMRAAYVKEWNALAAEHKGSGGFYRQYAGSGDLDWSESMSLNAFKNFDNTLNELENGPIAEIGKKLNLGIEKAFEEANVSEEDRTALLDQISQIDWSDYDAFEQFEAIFEGMGYSIDTASGEWDKFITTMRQASGAIPDFTKLKDNLSAMARITKDLKLGDIVSEEDYNTLVKTNKAYADLFTLQADGSRKFIGNAETMREATKQMALDQKELLDSYKNVVDIEAVAKFNWDDADREGAAQAFKDLYTDEENEALRTMLDNAGYTEEIINEIITEAANGDISRLEVLFDLVQKATDPAQMAVATQELEEMIASTATTVEELQAMLANNTISQETYSKSLIALASGYEYCAEAVKAYQEALASGEGVEEAEAALERVVELEREAAKYKGAWKNAISGKASMTAEDLTALKEMDPNLYAEYLSMSDEEWYNASYEAYSQWLSARIAGYPEDSAAYKALMMEKRQLDKDYYEQAREKAIQAKEEQDAIWDKQYEASSNAMGIISDNLTSTEALSFQNIVKLEQELTKAGVSAERIKQILTDVQSGDSTEAVRAKTVAAMEAAFMGLAAQNEKAKEYNGLITIGDIDVSDWVKEELDNLSHPQGTINFDAETSEPDAYITGITSSITPTKIIFNASDGGSYEETLSSIISNPKEKTITFIGDVGSEYTMPLAGVTATADKKITFTGENGETYTTTYKNAVLGKNKTITFIGETGTLYTSTYNTATAGANKTIVFQGDDTVYQAKYSSLMVNPGNKTIGITLLNSDGTGQTLQMQLDRITLENKAVVFEGEFGTIEEQLKSYGISSNGEGSITIGIETEEGTILDSELEGVSLTAGKLTFSTNLGEIQGDVKSLATDITSLPEDYPISITLTNGEKTEINAGELSALMAANGNDIMATVNYLSGTGTDLVQDKEITVKVNYEENLRQEKAASLRESFIRGASAEFIAGFDTNDVRSWLEGIQGTETESTWFGLGSRDYNKLDRIAQNIAYNGIYNGIYNGEASEFGVMVDAIGRMEVQSDNDLAYLEYIQELINSIAEYDKELAQKYQLVFDAALELNETVNKDESGYFSMADLPQAPDPASMPEHDAAVNAIEQVTDQEALNGAAGTTYTQASTAFELYDWHGIGTSVAEGISQGIADGIASFTPPDFSPMAGATKDAAAQAYDVNSPSKIMKPIGHGVVEGIEVGIDEGIAGSDGGDFTPMAQHSLENAQSAFGVHSPSVLFMPIGEDAVAGVEVGIDNGTANAAGGSGWGDYAQRTFTNAQGAFAAIDTAGIGGTLRSHITDEWSAWEQDPTSVLNYNSTSGRFEYDQNTTLGLTMSQQDTDWLNWYNTYGRYGSNGYTDFVVSKTEADKTEWLSQQTFEEGTTAEQQNQAWLDHLQTEWENAIQNIPSFDLAEMSEDYITNYWKTISTNTADFTEYQRGILSEYVAEALAKGYTGNDITTYVQGKLDEQGLNIKFAVGEAWGQIKNIMAEGVATIVKEEQDAAKQVYEAWVSAFAAISKARLELMGDSDGSLLSSMQNDVAGLSDLYVALLNQGYTLEQIWDIVTATGDDKQDKPSLLNYGTPDFNSYRQSGNQRYLNWDGSINNGFGGLSDTSVDDFFANLSGTWFGPGGQVTSEMNEILFGKNGLISDDLIARAALGKTTDQEDKVLGIYESLGLVTRNAETGAYEKGSADAFMNDPDMARAIISQVLGIDASWLQYNKGEDGTITITVDEDSRGEAKTWVQGVQGGAMADMSALNMQMASQITQENMVAINKQQEELTLLEKARDSGIESLTVAEQDQLRGILGLSEGADLSAVSLDTLTGAAEAAAQALMQMANQAQTDEYMALQGYKRNADGSYSLSYDDATMTGMGYSKDANGNWVRGEGDAQETLMTTVSGADAYARASGYETGNIVVDNAADGTTGKQVAANNRLALAKDAGFASVQDQDDYIEKMVAEGGDSDYSDGGMASAEEIKEALGLESLDEAIEKQREYANQMKAMERGFKDLSASGKQWIKTLKEGTGSIEDQIAAQKGLRKGYKDILGFTDKQMDALGDSFLQNSDYLELAEIAASDAGEKGQAALDKLQVAAASAITPFDDLVTKVNGTNQTMAELADIVAGIDLDIGAAFEGADYTAVDNYWNTIVDKCLASGDSIGEAVAIANDALNGLGVDVNPQLEIVTETLDPVGFQAILEKTGTKTVTVPDGVGGTREVTYDEFKQMYEEAGSTSIPFTYVKGKGAPGANKYTKRAERPGSGSGRRSGGGGGGGREARRANHTTDKADRYHEIDNAIDDLSDAYNRLNKQEDRAWGKNRIDAMKQEVNLIQQQADAIARKTKEAQDYLKMDKNEAEMSGWIFDKDGNVSNYDEKWAQIVKSYNDAINKYNKMSASKQEELDKKYAEKTDKDGVFYSSYEDYLKKTLIDDPKKALEQYEETKELLEDLSVEYEDYLNSWHDTIVNQIQTKLDIMLEVSEQEFKYLEHKLGRISDDAYAAADAIAFMGEQMAISQDKFSANKDALNDLLKAYNENWSVEALMSNQITKEDLANANMTSTDIKLIETIIENLTEASEDMSKQMADSFKMISDTFEIFNQNMEKYISTVEHAQTITSTYKNIINLTGKTISGFNSIMLNSINATTVAQSQFKLNTKKISYETIQKEFEAAQTAYDQAKASYESGGINSTALKAAKDTYDKAQDNMNKAQEEFLTSWEETLQAAADAFQSNMEAVVDEVGKMMANGLAGGLSELENQFAKIKEQDEDYVDDYEKIYQLTKMTRDLENRIDNSTNVRMQKQLLKYQKEINNLLESDQKMSKYDIEYLQKKIDLKLAEMALDEAQNAKSKVTMRRDSEGNYNYIYTADENAVEKAEDDYANKLYEMQVANDNYITSLSETMAGLSSQMLSEIAAIDTTIYDTEEKYQAELQRITDHYATQMAYYNSEMNKVLDNNKQLYEKDWTWFNKYTGYKISAIENYVTDWNKTMLSQVTGFDNQEEFFENFNQAIYGGNPENPSSDSLIGRLISAYSTMRQQIADANAAAGIETENLADILVGSIETATSEAAKAASDITDAAIEIVNQIASVSDAIDEMVAEYSSAIQKMETETGKMIDILLDFLKLYGAVGDLNIDPGVLATIEENRKKYQQENPEGYDTGGYTGAWGSEGRLAYLHQKELVLNANDTQNMLASIGILRQIANVIDLNALAASGGFAPIIANGILSNREPLQQEVHIEASFPAVTDKNQIEEAFTDLVNLAAQYANR